MVCKYCHEEFCTNDQCPMCADYCPVHDVEGVCRFEERVDEAWRLTPKGCLHSALAGYFEVDDFVFDGIWEKFVECMQRLGYIENSEDV